MPHRVKFSVVLIRLNKLRSRIHSDLCWLNTSVKVSAVETCSESQHVMEKNTPVSAACIQFKAKTNRGKSWTLIQSVDSLLFLFWMRFDCSEKWMLKSVWNLTQHSQKQQRVNKEDTSSNRWVDTEMVRQVDILGLIHSSYPTDVQTWLWRLVWQISESPNNKSPPPHAFSLLYPTQTPSSRHTQHNTHMQSHYHGSAVLWAACQDVVVMRAPVDVEDRPGVSNHQRVVFIHTACLQPTVSVTQC